jgi:hypothetical protein
MAKKAKKRKRSGGDRVTTLVNLAAAAVGLASLARELMQRHEAAKPTDEGQPDQRQAPEQRTAAPTQRRRCST